MPSDQDQPILPLFHHSNTMNMLRSPPQRIATKYKKTTIKHLKEN
jgi:hypothetical protein